MHAHESNLVLRNPDENQIRMCGLEFILISILSSAKILNYIEINQLFSGNIAQKRKI